MGACAVVQIERVAGVDMIVGESPIWDGRTQLLWFIDIEGRSVHRLGPGDVLDTWQVPIQPGAVATMSDGRVAVALHDGFRVLDPETGALGPLTPGGISDVERISEGKADRQGRLLAGSRDHVLKASSGRLLRLESDGSTTTLRRDIIVSNGICLSIDGSTIFFSDSFTGRVYAADYGDEGLAHEREIYSTAGEIFFPDGATVDAEGFVWIALLHTPEVIRLAPDGTLVDRIEMPSPYLTSLAFGGPNLDELYVTSLNPARFPDGTPAQAPDFPGAEGGFLYRVTGLGVRGVAEAPVAPWATADAVAEAE